MAPIRVVGVGSPHGDDAIGLEVIRRLRARQKDFRGVEFIEIDSGQRLLDLLDGQGRLILIDALADAEQAGAVVRLEWPDARLEVLRPGSTHRMRPAEALQLAEALGLLPARIVFFGITIRKSDIGNEESQISSVVSSVIPLAVQRIEQELAQSE